MELTDAQLARTIVVYTSALLPLVIVIVLQVLGRLPGWVLKLYAVTFVLCALGWEIWLTYGLVDGLDVNARRPEALNAAIPLHINWILNSLADAGSIGLLGVVFVKWAYRGDDAPFREWRWGAFAILFAWFVGQNLWVELYIYQQQLAEGLRLSWGPLIPTGPWFNPVLFELGSKTVQLQTQLPWLLMTPIFYAVLIRLYSRDG